MHKYMVYNNNKTSHIIMQAIFGGAMPDSAHEWLWMRAFLLCQIWKTATQSKLESYSLRAERESFMHIHILVFSSELDHSIHSSVYFTPAIHTLLALHGIKSKRNHKMCGETHFYTCTHTHFRTNVTDSFSFHPFFVHSHWVCECMPTYLSVWILNFIFKLCAVVPMTT